MHIFLNLYTCIRPFSRDIGAAHRVDVQQAEATTHTQSVQGSICCMLSSLLSLTTSCVVTADTIQFSLLI